MIRSFMKFIDGNLKEPYQLTKANYGLFIAMPSHLRIICCVMLREPSNNTTQNSDRPMAVISRRWLHVMGRRVLQPPHVRIDFRVRLKTCRSSGRVSRCGRRLALLRGTLRGIFSVWCQLIERDGMNQPERQRRQCCQMWLPWPQ